MGEPPINRPAGLHHVAIRSKDFDRSVAFYTDVLGFEPAIGWGEKPGRTIMLDAGDGNHLEIFERPGEDWPGGEHGAVLHLAIRTRDVDGDTERVRRAGCQVTTEPCDVELNTTIGPNPVAVRLSFFRGPDGEVVELFANKLT